MSILWFCRNSLWYSVCHSLLEERVKLIKHIVMWKFKDSYQNMNKQEIIARVRSELEGLKESIAEIRAMEVGENFNNLEVAFDVSLYSEFESKESLRAYQEHPEHIKVAQFIRDVRTATVVVDYEV